MILIADVAQTIIPVMVTISEVEPLLSVGELITIGVMIASVTSMVVTNKNTAKSTKEDIARLEKKQDKYNNLQERTKGAEESTKIAHNRLNDFKEDICNVDIKLDKILDKITDHVEKFHVKKED